MSNHLKVILLLLMSNASFAADVSVGFTMNREPFVHKNGGGLEVALVRAALALSGHNLKPVYFKTKNLQQALDVSRVDAVSNMKQNQLEQFKGKAFLSNPFVSFNNYVVTKKDSTCLVSTPASLAKCKLAAWSGAHMHLQGKWRDYFDNPAVKMNKNYFELSDQNAQVKLLLQDRVDALLIDKSIFRYQYNSTLHPSKKALYFEYHRLFDSQNQLSLAFSDQKLRDDFNKGLKALKSSGEYDVIVSRELGETDNQTASTMPLPSHERQHTQ